MPCLGGKGVERGVFWLKLTEFDIILEEAILRPPHLRHFLGEVSVDEGWELALTLFARPARLGW